MGAEVTSLCIFCGHASRWPEEVFERTGRRCARCLEERPGLLMQLVAAEGGPFRSATLTPPAMRWGLRGTGPLGALLGGTLGIAFQSAYWPGHPWTHRAVLFAGLMLLNLGVWALIFVRRVPR